MSKLLKNNTAAHELARQIKDVVIMIARYDAGDIFHALSNNEANTSEFNSTSSLSSSL